MDKQYFIRLFLIVFFTTSVSAQVSDSMRYDIGEDTIAPKNDRLEFPMKDLINMKVMVASKKEEKISDAPNSITAYSSKDIEQLGYYTLADLAGITSGYTVNYQYGETGFETRGQRAGAFENNKHLLLIDGIPVNFARSFKAQTQEELPLFFAQRVEFLKGPASALYGVSAFYGVVNILSKEPVANGTFSETKISGGNWNNNFRVMSNMMHRTNTGTSSLNAGYFYKNPSGDLLSDPAYPTSRYWDKNASLFLRTSHAFSGKAKGLSTGIIFMQRTGGIGESWIRGYSSQANSIVWRTIIPYLKYQKSFSNKLMWSSYLKLNNSMEEANYGTDDTLKAVSFYKSNVVNIEVLSELRYDFNTRNSLILGINYDRRKEQGSPTSYSYYVVGPDTATKRYSIPLGWDFTDPSFAFNTISAYTQYQKQIGFLSGLNITGGLRFDLGIIDTFHYHQFSPRIAIVQKITPNLILKIMSGKALRVPTIKEIGVTSQFLEELQRRNLVIPDLNPMVPESTQTYEAGLSYNTIRMRISTTVFYTETKNEIKQSTLENKTGNILARGVWLENRPDTMMMSRGIEIDLAYAITKEVKVFSNYTYVLAQDSKKLYQSGIPATRINAGALCALTGKYKFKGSITMSHIDGYLVENTEKRFTHASTFYDVNLIFPITETVHTEVQVRNIFNRQLYFPTGIPLRGRTFQITLGVNFK